MATLYVTEFSYAGGTPNAPLQIPKFPATVPGYSFAITGASTTSGVKFNKNTRYVWIKTDAICSIEIGTTPTAVATANRLAADQDLFAEVSPGDTIAVISNT